MRFNHAEEHVFSESFGCWQTQASLCDQSFTPTAVYSPPASYCVGLYNCEWLPEVVGDPLTFHQAAARSATSVHARLVGLPYIL
jgi:hypothetical protein